MHSFAGQRGHNAVAANPISTLYHQREEAIADYRDALRLQSGLQILEPNNVEIREALKRLGATP